MKCAIRFQILSQTAYERLDGHLDPVTQTRLGKDRLQQKVLPSQESTRYQHSSEHTLVRNLHIHEFPLRDNFVALLTFSLAEPCQNSTARFVSLMTRRGLAAISAFSLRCFAKHRLHSQTLTNEKWMAHLAIYWAEDKDDRTRK